MITISTLKNRLLLRKVISFFPVTLSSDKFHVFHGENSIPRHIFRFIALFIPNNRYFSKNERTDIWPYYPFIHDERLYLKLCENIKYKPNEILPKDLAFVPFAACNNHKEKHFVDYILPLWWNQMESNLENIFGYKLVSTIFALEKINYFCNGDVIKFLNWNRIEKILQFCLSDIRRKQFNSRQFSILLHAMVNLKESYSSETRLSEEMQLMLSKSFSLFFSPQVIKEKVNILDHIGEILLRSSKLGFIKIPQEELKNVIPICLEVFSSNNICKNQQWLNCCHGIGSALFALDYNPGNKFWAAYFNAVVKTYNIYSLKERFCVSVLKNCLLIGLKFSTNEFKNISHFWKPEMAKISQHLRRAEIDEILDLCLKMYDGNLQDIEDILSKNILHQLLTLTDSFIVTDKLCYSTVPLPAWSKTDVKLDETNYFNICNQLISYSEPNSISARTLIQIPDASIRFNSESVFVKDISLKWWSAFKLQLQDMQGYILVHPLYALMKINRKLNDELNKQFIQLKEHPAQTLASFALKDVENENFTHHTYGALLVSVDRLLLRSIYYKISLKLIAEISSSFNTFFSPKLFYRRAFVYKCHKNIGDILYRGKFLSVPRLPEDILQVVIMCCAENFNVQLANNDVFDTRQHLWNLLKSVETLLEWNVDANKYYPSFWRFYFNEILINYPKLNQINVDLMLKKGLLTSVLFVVLKFDKENDFKLIKCFWQSKMKLHLDTFYIDEIDNILNSSVIYGKFEYLDDIVSSQILDEFKRRIGSM